MKIDIISYTDAQFAELSEEQILQVQQAQLKKERLDIRLEEEILKEKHRLIENGIFLSPIWELYKAKKQEEHDLEVETLREALLFHLQFSAKPSGESTRPAPRLPEPSQGLTMTGYFTAAASAERSLRSLTSYACSVSSTRFSYRHLRTRYLFLMSSAEL